MLQIWLFGDIGTVSSDRIKIHKDEPEFYLGWNYRFVNDHGMKLPFEKSSLSFFLHPFIVFFSHKTISKTYLCLDIRLPITSLLSKSYLFERNQNVYRNLRVERGLGDPPETTTLMQESLLHP